MIMISRLAKKIGQAFSPKKVTKATKKVLPKVSTGGLLISSGIAVKDSKILATIAEQKVKYEKETDTAISHRAVSRDKRIEELEREIRELNSSRMNV